MKRHIKNKRVFFYVILFFILLSDTAYSLTLDEAISLARETLPFYKASMIRTISTEALYKASLGPYLPSLDASTVQQRFYTSPDEFGISSYDVTLSYTLFDGGNRKASRNIARLNFDISKEDLRKSFLDLEFNVKTAFYASIARRDTLEQRKIQLLDAQKDYEVAEGRHKFGVAKLLDVLQSSVRLEQAKFALVQAESEFKKALLELNSLIGKPLVRSNEMMMIKLKNSKWIREYEFSSDLLEEAAIENRQAIEMAKIYRDIQSGMMDASASVISNNLNMVMKALTLFTIIQTIPILLASLYGMNVKLPLQDSPHAFYGIIGVATVFALLGFGFFIKKKWLD